MGVHQFIESNLTLSHALVTISKKYVCVCGWGWWFPTYLTSICKLNNRVLPFITYKSTPVSHNVAIDAKHILKIIKPSTSLLYILLSIWWHHGEKFISFYRWMLWVCLRKERRKKFEFDFGRKIIVQNLFLKNFFFAKQHSQQNRYFMFVRSATQEKYQPRFNPARHWDNKKANPPFTETK